MCDKLTGVVSSQEDVLKSEIDNAYSTMTDVNYLLKKLIDYKKESGMTYSEAIESLKQNLFDSYRREGKDMDKSLDDMISEFQTFMDMLDI